MLKLVKIELTPEAKTFWKKNKKKILLGTLSTAAAITGLAVGTYLVSAALEGGEEEGTTDEQEQILLDSINGFVAMVEEVTAQ